MSYQFVTIFLVVHGNLSDTNFIMFLLSLLEIYFINVLRKTVFREPVMVGVIILVIRRTDFKILLEFLVFKNDSMVQTK